MVDNGMLNFRIVFNFWKTVIKFLSHISCQIWGNFKFSLNDKFEIPFKFSTFD